MTAYGLIQVSAGEEGIAIGSASALAPEDVIFCQYRETGVFQQRGFTLSDFMNQLFANSKDNGKGRNMPVHYGSSKLNIVRYSICFIWKLVINTS
jgi:2-oxoisovalerate dehydrogenase E1 component alpha subunit